MRKTVVKASGGEATRATSLNGSGGTVVTTSRRSNRQLSGSQEISV
jgi:hypothetical protein